MFIIIAYYNVFPNIVSYKLFHEHHHFIPLKTALSTYLRKKLIPFSFFQSAINEDSNNIAKRHVRVAREAEDAALEEVEDTDPAESNLDEVELEQDRNKRFLPFGGHDDGHAGGGSGNFLFDLVRVRDATKATLT